MQVLNGRDGLLCAPAVKIHDADIAGAPVKQLRVDDLRLDISPGQGAGRLGIAAPVGEGESRPFLAPDEGPQLGHRKRRHVLPVDGGDDISCLQPRA